MRILKRLALVTGTLVLFGQFAAVADPNEDKLLKVILTLSATKSGTVCGKGDALRKVYSLRSFDGTLCSINYVAAFAMLECKGIGDFDGSHCERAAVAALNGADPKSVLQTSIKKKQTNARKLLCSQTQKLSPGAAKVASSLCTTP